MVRARERERERGKDRAKKERYLLVSRRLRIRMNTGCISRRVSGCLRQDMESPKRVGLSSDTSTACIMVVLLLTRALIYIYIYIYIYIFTGTSEKTSPECSGTLVGGRLIVGVNCSSTDQIVSSRKSSGVHRGAKGTKAPSRNYFWRNNSVSMIIDMTKCVLANIQTAVR